MSTHDSVLQLLLCCSSAACFVSIHSRCSYSLHNRGVLFEAAKDQAQMIAVRLLSIAGNACARNRALAQYMATHSALNICKLFKDPQTLWVSGVHTLSQHACLNCCLPCFITCVNRQRHARTLTCRCHWHQHKLIKPAFAVGWPPAHLLSRLQQQLHRRVRLLLRLAHALPHPRHSCNAHGARCRCAHTRIVCVQMEKTLAER